MKNLKTLFWDYQTKQKQGYISYFLENRLGATGRFLFTILVVMAVFSLDPNRNYGFLIFGLSLSIYINLMIYRIWISRHEKYKKVQEKCDLIAKAYSEMMKEKKLVAIKKNEIAVEILPEIKDLIRKENFFDNLNLSVQLKINDMLTYREKVFFDRLSNYCYINYQSLEKAHIQFKRRGVFQLEVQMKLQDLLNVFQTHLVSCHIPYYVIPQIKTVASLNEQIKSVMLSISEKEQELSRDKLNQDIDIKNLRPYVPGDPIKMIHWKKSFKNNPFETGHFIVKEMEEEASLKKNLYIDLSSDSEEEFENYMTFITSFLFNQSYSIQDNFNEIHLGDVTFKSQDIEKKEIHHELVKKICEAQYINSEESKNSFALNAQTDFFIFFFSRISSPQEELLKKIPHGNYLVFLIHSDESSVNKINNNNHISMIKIDKDLYDF